MSGKCSRARPRDSIEDDEDDHVLDEMLIELGIPINTHTMHDASVEVIELITPPRNVPPVKKRKQSDGPSIVDLTTSPTSFCPSHNAAAEQKTLVVDDEQQQDEISFSYSPSECPLPFVASLSPENSSLLDIVSPHLPSSTRRQVFLDDNTQTAAKQARRLSGRLEDLHFETTRSSENDMASVTDAATVTSDEPSSARTAISCAGSKTRSSSSRSKSALRGGAAAVVAVVQMEKSLDTSIVGESIRDALKGHVYNGKPVPFTVTTALNCILPGVIRWERRGSGTSCYACGIYYKASGYLKMLEKKSYKELVAAVQYLQTLVPKPQARAGKPCEPEAEEEPNKYFIIVEGMDRALIKLKKRQKEKKGSIVGRTSSTNFPMITFADLHEVAFQLFMDVGAHTKFTPDLDATANYIALLTRELVVASSRASALEEVLEAVPRYNSFRVTHTGATASVCANAWLRMLQVIPGVSEDKAQCLLDHFPTFSSLMRAYRDPNLSRAQKQDLVADKLHDARIQRALSKRIYTVFCEENPDALI